MRGWWILAAALAAGTAAVAEPAWRDGRGPAWERDRRPDRSPACISPRVWIPLGPAPEGPAERGAEEGATLPSFGWPLAGGVEVAPSGACPEVRRPGRAGDGPRRRR